MSFNMDIFSTLNHQMQVHPSHEPSGSTRDVRLVGYRWDFEFQAKPDSFIFVNEDTGETYFSQDTRTIFKKPKLEWGDRPFSKEIKLELEMMVQQGADARELTAFRGWLSNRLRNYGYALHDIAQEWFTFPFLDDTETAEVLASVIEHDTHVLIRAVTDVKRMAQYLSGDGDTDEKLALRQYINSMDTFYDKYVKDYYESIQRSGDKFSLDAVIQKWNGVHGKHNHYVAQDFMF